MVNLGKEKANYYLFQRGVISLVKKAGIELLQSNSSEFWKGVTKVNHYAFEDREDLTQITIGNGVKYIGFYAFKGCRFLTEITIPTSVMEVGEDMFLECKSLKFVNVKLCSGKFVKIPADKFIEMNKKVINMAVLRVEYSQKYKIKAKKQLKNNSKMINNDIVYFDSENLQK